MPYKLSNPPKRIEGLPKDAKEAWIKAYNSAWESYKEDKDREAKSNATAWSQIKKMGYEKKDGEWSKMSAMYRGKKANLNQPFRTPKGPKKFSVYVKNDKGNVVKVNFGDPKMEIKRDDPESRKSFRARHKCDTKDDPTTPGYWSCKTWQKNKTVSELLSKASDGQAITASSLDPSGLTVSATFDKKKKKDQEESKMEKDNMKESEKDKNGGKSKMASMKKNLVYTTKDGEKVTVTDISENKVVIKREGKKDQQMDIEAFLALIGKPVDDSKMKEHKKEKDSKMEYDKDKKEKEDKKSKMKKDNKKMSKFSEDVASKKIGTIIETLRNLAANKKPEDEISLTVKSCSHLIDDLKSIKEVFSVESEEEDKEEEKGKEDEDKDTEEEKGKEDKKAEKEEEDKEEDSEEGEGKEKESKDESKDKKEEDESGEGKESDESEEDKDDSGEEDEEETSKFKELMEVCEGYKKSLEEKDSKISKMSKELSEIKKEKDQLSKEMSKFKEDSYMKTLNKTLETVSKFRGLDKDQKLRLKEHYLTSKMSEDALEEIGKKTEYQMMSKMAYEPKETTKPTEYLDPAVEKEDISKMSAKDQLDRLADLHAKKGGFVQ